MKARHAAVVAGLLTCLTSGVARADFIGTFTQVGQNVEFVGSGTFSLLGLTPVTESLQANDSGIAPIVGLFVSGVPSGATQPVSGYLGFSGPQSFGSGGLALADSTSGNVVGLESGMGQTALFLSPSYRPGSELTTSMEFMKQSLSSLGLDRGSYVYTSAGDTITINIGTVPLPASAPLFGAGLIALGVAGYVGKRRKAAAA